MSISLADLGCKLHKIHPQCPLKIYIRKHISYSNIETSTLGSLFLYQPTTNDIIVDYLTTGLNLS